MTVAAATTVDELVDERERVALEHRPPGRALGADEHELATPLAESEEERQQRGADEEPRRDADVDRVGAGRGADDEEPGDRHHVDEHHVLERRRVRDLERDEAGQQRHRGRAQEGRAADRSGGEKARGGERRPWRELATRKRPPPLHRVAAVVLDVPHVVDEVRGARGGAVDGERGQRLEPTAGVPDLRGEDDAGEEEQVLRPLARPRGDDERDVRPAPWLQRRDLGARRALRSGTDTGGILVARSRHTTGTDTCAFRR